MVAGSRAVIGSTESLLPPLSPFSAMSSFTAALQGMRAAQPEGLQGWQKFVDVLTTAHEEDIKKTIAAAMQEATKISATAATAAAPAGGGHKKFDMPNDLTPHEYDGKNRANFKTWAMKTRIYLSNKYNHAKDMLEFAAAEEEHLTTERWVKKAGDAFWSDDYADFNKFVYGLLISRTPENPYRMVLNSNESNGMEAWRNSMQNTIHTQ